MRNLYKNGTAPTRAGRGLDFSFHESGERLARVKKRHVQGGFWTFVGYMLSPLSWWNDLFVNVPLALVFAWVVSWFHPAAFAASFVAGYWLTNVLGLILMHHGLRQLSTAEAPKFSRWSLPRDIAISLVYTCVIVALVKLKLLAPLPDYLPKR